MQRFLDIFSRHLSQHQCHCWYTICHLKGFNYLFRAGINLYHRAKLIYNCCLSYKICCIGIIATAANWKHKIINQFVLFVSCCLQLSLCSACFLPWNCICLYLLCCTFHHLMSSVNSILLLAVQTQGLCVSTGVTSIMRLFIKGAD